MPPKAPSNTLSDREVELLRNMTRCLKSKPDIDMEKFSTMSEFGSVASARSNIYRLLAKLAGSQLPRSTTSPTKGAEDASADPDTPVAGKKKGGSRKRKTDSAADDEDDAITASPVKKKASPTKRKGKGDSEDELEQDEDEPVIKDEDNVNDDV